MIRHQLMVIVLASILSLVDLPGCNKREPNLSLVDIESVYYGYGILQEADGTVKEYPYMELHVDAVTAMSRNELIVVPYLAEYTPFFRNKLDFSYIPADDSAECKNFQQKDSKQGNVKLLDDKRLVATMVEPGYKGRILTFKGSARPGNNDFAGRFTGTYKGSGSLEKSGMIFQKYPEMTIKVNYLRDNLVEAVPYVDSKPFFSDGSGIEYKVIEANESGYTLQPPTGGLGYFDITYSDQLKMDYPYVKTSNGGGFSLKFTGQLQPQE